MSADPRLPDFLVIGAMKSGTTSLYHYLREHPEVFMPETKELDFFAERKNWRRGWDWYVAQFAGAGDAGAVGEASPAYANDPNHPGVAARVKAHLPDVKLVYIVRDPVDRIDSHYRHRVRYEGVQGTADEAVFADLDRYLGPSRYAHQIDRYLEQYAPDRLLVIRTEDLRDDRRATLARVYRHIGVDPTFVPQNVEQEFLTNPPARRRRRFGRRRAPATASRLSLPARAELAALLRPDTTRLPALLGPEFDTWGVG